MSFPRYDIESSSFVNMPSREGDAVPFDDFLISSPAFPAPPPPPPSLSTSSSSSTASSYPITPTQPFYTIPSAMTITPPQAQWNEGGRGGGFGAHQPFSSSSLPVTPDPSPIKPLPLNYERARPQLIPPNSGTGLVQGSPPLHPNQPFNRPQGSTLPRKERPPVSIEVLQHRENVQKEAAVHQSKSIPSVVSRTEQKIRFVYTSEAQLPPPLRLSIEGVSSSTRLPLLPPLQEPLFSMVFTHTSWSSSKKRAFADPDGDALYDYERLEHLGDALLTLITTELIQDLFPRVTPGGASVLRSNLVNNKHALSALAVSPPLPLCSRNLLSNGRRDADPLLSRPSFLSQTSYHLHTQLRASPAQVLALKLQPVVRSQLFEAYLAAISEQYGFEFARAWLREVMTPIATAGYETFKAKAEEDARPKPGDADHQGYTAMLIEWGKINEVQVECIENDVTYNQKNQKIYSFSLRVQKGIWGEEEGGWYDFGPAQASQKKVAKRLLCCLPLPRNHSNFRHERFFLCHRQQRGSRRPLIRLQLASSNFSLRFPFVVPSCFSLPCLSRSKHIPRCDFFCALVVNLVVNEHRTLSYLSPSTRLSSSLPLLSPFLTRRRGSREPTSLE
ncbi:hypothetical protein BDY24DRAFT_436065 [Mrakia frigida]|uniref:ribonuclease III domain-containing protein n=1 Tax=Mrakia frigida TaxID=29902 RepID=UPI003FCBF730